MLRVSLFLLLGCGMSQSAEVPITLMIGRSPEPGVVEFVELDVETDVERVHRRELPHGRTARSLVAGPLGEHAVLWARIDGGPDVPHVISWRHTGVVDLVASVASCPGRIRRVEWRDDGRALFFVCQDFERVDGLHTLVESILYRHDLGGRSQRLASDCAIPVVRTDRGLVYRHGPTCDTAYELRLREGERDVALADRGGVHGWWNDAALVSDLGVHEDEPRPLRRVSESTVSPAGLEVPTGALTMPISNRGILPLAFRRVAEVHRVEWIRLSDATPTAAHSITCSNVDGVPQHVRWSPDGETLALSCREGTFLMGEAEVRPLTSSGLMGPDVALAWSPDSRWLLRGRHRRDLSTRYTLVVAASGDEREIVVEEGSFLAWRAHRPTPGCAELAICR